MIFYRYDQIEFYDRPGLRESTFQLIKETPCGHWIRSIFPFNTYSALHEKRWVSKTARKRFAYPTREEALYNFIARKLRQISMLNYQLERAAQAWELAEEKLKELCSTSPNTASTAR